MTTRKKKVEPEIAAIKGMNRDMTCRGFQFESGTTYTIDGPIEVCVSGFHSCPADAPPHVVFQYYPPGTSRFFDVTASGKIERDGDKIASASITIGVELTVGELVSRRVDNWCVKTAKGAAANSGDYGAASNSGRFGAASNSGDYGAAANSGYRGAASNSGYRGAAFSHAYDGKVMCEGDGQALYCSEFNMSGELVSAACGITGQDGIKAGVWYTTKGGKLVECGA